MIKLFQVDWFFSDDDLDDLSRLSVNLSLPADTSEIETTTSSNNHNLLLNNIQKVEGKRVSLFHFRYIVHYYYYFKLK